MLAYVPVRFDLYRSVRPALRWTLQNLISFADRAGRCFPSVRKLAAVAGISKSTASRHLIELERAGTISRQRRPGGVYAYTIAARFLPAAKHSAREVSHHRDMAVPPARTEENPIKKKSDSQKIVREEPPLSPSERAQRVARLDEVLASIALAPNIRPRQSRAARLSP